MKRLLILLLAACVIVPGLILARADAVIHNSVVSETAQPCVPLDVGTFGDGTGRQVWDIQPGKTTDLMYAAGKFDGPRHNLAAYTHGCQVASWNPTVNGAVYTARPTGDGWVTIGGGFTKVNGQPQPYLAQVDAVTGALNPDFRPHLDGTVRMALQTRGQILVGGSFDATLTSVDPDTGASTPYLTPTITGHPHRTDEPVGVPNIFTGALQGKHRLAVVFDAKRVDGHARSQVAVWNLGADRAHLSAWDPRVLHNDRCGGDRRLAAQDVVYGGGSLFVAATGGPHPGICDAVTAFDARTGDRLWTNETCNDSLYAVAYTGAGVYAQGHQKCHEKTPGSVDGNTELSTDTPGFRERNGIAALNPANGNLFRWRSDQPRCLGGKVLTPTETGLWGGLDCPFNDSPITYRPLPSTV